jgi:hypothetical protein
MNLNSVLLLPSCDGVGIHRLKPLEDVKAFPFGQASNAPLVCRRPLAKSLCGSIGTARMTRGEWVLPLAWIPAERKSWEMATGKQTRLWVRRSASVLVGGGLALSAFGLPGVPGPRVLAAPAPPPNYHWCPGDQWNPGWGTAYNWDWNRCHDWEGRPGQSGPAGWGPWGPPPPWAAPQPPPPSWAPGAQLMWNPTANGWGFWNNGIWTPA